MVNVYTFWSRHLVLGILEGSILSEARSRTIPIYQQVQRHLRDLVTSGELQPGHLVPSERELCEQFGISRMTVRQAIQDLAQEGVFYRQRGRGTFVAKPKVEQKNLMSFSEIIRERGGTPGAKVLALERRQAGDKLCARFPAFSPSDLVYALKRLRTVDGHPVGVEQAYVLSSAFPGLDCHDLTQSLYRILTQVYDRYPYRRETNISAALPLPDETVTLHITTRTPVLRVGAVDYDRANTAFMYSESVYRGDLYSIWLEVFSQGQGPGLLNNTKR